MTVRRVETVVTVLTVVKVVTKKTFFFTCKKIEKKRRRKNHKKTKKNPEIIFSHTKIIEKNQIVTKVNNSICDQIQKLYWNKTKKKKF